MALSLVCTVCRKDYSIPETTKRLLPECCRTHGMVVSTGSIKRENGLVVDCQQATSRSGDK